MEALLALFFTFGLMWLLLIRPQQRRMRAHQEVVAALRPGDDVVTAGGIHGTVTSVDQDDIRMEIAPGVVIRVLRGAISQRSGPYEESEEDDDEDDEYEDDVDSYDEQDDDEAEPTAPRRALDENGS